MINDICELSLGELDVVSGGVKSELYNVGYAGPRGNFFGRGVGEGDTIDTDMTDNGHLPGKGMWGN